MTTEYTGWKASEQIVGFFSYKGGVGRTVMLCNTLLALFQEMHRRDGARHGVFAVDMDLPAPGILPILGITSHRNPVFQGILDGTTHQQNLKDRAVRLSFSDGNVPIQILADPQPDPRAVTFMGQLFADDEDPELLSRALRYLKDCGRKEFEAPFTCVDLGAGFGDLPREVFRLIDQLVVVARGDRQHRNALPSLLEGLGKSFETHRRPAVHVVINQLPQRWFGKDRTELDDFLDSSGIHAFMAEAERTEQIRKLHIAPLVPAALTHEPVLFPKDWQYTNPEAATDHEDESDAHPITRLVRTARTPDERKLQKMIGSLASHILDREVT